MSSRVPSVLVVEDNDGYSYLTRRMLERLAPAFDVRVVRDGLQALELLREWQPHLVLLDLVLPTVSGLELLRVLKADARLSVVPVIVLTGHGDDASVWHVYQQYANAVLVKPDGVESLQAMLAALHAFWFQSAALPPGVPHALGKRDVR